MWILFKSFKGGVNSPNIFIFYKVYRYVYFIKYKF
nr:MAG TPA: hypothetical protein [Caudoviricetes sp.]